MGIYRCGIIAKESSSLLGKGGGIELLKIDSVYIV
jgi:hypothetical protein